MLEDVLRKFEITEAALLGNGAESRTYALPENKMLRVYVGDSEKKKELQILKAFYSGIAGKFSFKTPFIQELGEESGTLFTIGDLIPGSVLSDVLPKLVPEDKKKAYSNYFDAMEEIRSVSFPERSYGQIISLEPRIAPTWTGFLQKTIREFAEKHERFLGEDIEDFPAVVEKLCEEAQIFDQNPPKYLVHGDYFPNNVIVDESLNVAGVIDFSAHTLVGDHMLDVVSCHIFIDPLDISPNEDSQVLWPIIEEKYGKGLQKTIDFYRPYFGIYFGEKGGIAGDVYPKVYPWCVKNIKDFQARFA